MKTFFDFSNCSPRVWLQRFQRRWHSSWLGKKSNFPKKKNLMLIPCKKSYVWKAMENINFVFLLLFKTFPTDFKLNSIYCILTPITLRTPWFRRKSYENSSFSFLTKIRVHLPVDMSSIPSSWPLVSPIFSWKSASTSSWKELVSYYKISKIIVWRWGSQRVLVEWLCRGCMVWSCD